MFNLDLGEATGAIDNARTALQDAMDEIDMLVEEKKQELQDALDALDEAESAVDNAEMD